MDQSTRLVEHPELCKVIPVSVVINYYKSLQDNITGIEADLKSLRCSDKSKKPSEAWEKDIQNDPRVGVQLLYNTLKELRSNLDEFLEEPIKLVDTQQD